MGHQPHLFLPPPWSSPQLPLEAHQEHHLFRVTRLAPGDTVTYTDGCGCFGHGRLAPGHIERGEERLVDPPPLHLTIAVAPPRDRDRLRFLVEKLAELEVAELLWLRTRFTQTAPPPAEKSRAWALGALEQSRGAHQMAIGRQVVTVEDLTPPVLAADPGGGGWPSPLPPTLTIAIGPEGGWAGEDLPSGIEKVSVGRTVLRVETAAIVAAAQVFSQLGNP
ncbi:MAG TPA: RsmE family RNA methyltransferase [Acidimicrobiia bacterium]|nr:RsmE family RNA methyltransferase [Acidimicrobiia bacterium]